MYRLPDTHLPLEFPNNYQTTSEGLLAIGGNLHPKTLVNAYAKGIFPWYSENMPICWWHPEPRAVISPENVHFSRKMSQILKKIALPNRPLTPEKQALAPYTISFNKQFQAVIKECAEKRGPKRQSTWILPEMQNAFHTLHKLGFAHSVEVTNRAGQLCGGLYGVAIGRMFFGESMFSHETNTSKLALYWLCNLLVLNKFVLLDCQIESAHLTSLGAKGISRKQFLKFLTICETHWKQPVKFQF